MKTTTILSAICILAATAPVWAGTDAKDMKAMTTLRPESDAGFYVAAYGGASLFQDTNNAFNNHLNIPTESIGEASASNLRTAVGGVGGLKFGYNFESFALDDPGTWRLQPAVEAEAMYIGSTSTQDSTFLDFTAPGFGLPANVHTRTESDSVAGFINGILRFKNGSNFTPYIGAGVGGQYFSTTTSITINDPFLIGANFAQKSLHAEDAVFAAQALAGCDLKLTKSWSLFTEYKYVAAFDPSLTNRFTVPGFGPGTSSYSTNPNYVGQHLVTAGVKYSF